MLELRSAMLLLLAGCCLGILAVTFLMRSSGSEDGYPLLAVDGSPESNAATPDLDWAHPDASARTEEATIETPELLAERLAALRALPEGTLAEMTTKLDAYQRTLAELTPRRTVLRLKPGFDWKADWRCQHPELAAARDDRFRLEKLVRETRYAEYLASRE